MDSNTYGSLVSNGGYATGGTANHTGWHHVGESGPEVARLTAGGAVSRTSTLVASGYTPDQALTIVTHIDHFTDGDPDDGAAGVLAKV